MSVSGQLGGAPHKARRAAKRPFRFDQRSRNVIVLALLKAGNEVGDLLLVAIDVVSHHRQGNGRVTGHGAQSAAQLAIRAWAQLEGQSEESALLAGPCLGSVAR